VAASIAANTTTAPDGTLTADTFTGNGTNASHYIQGGFNVSSSSTQHTLSIYAKKNTNDFLQLNLAGGVFGSPSFANFDLNNGVVGLASGVTASIQSVGNGWYRCSMSKLSGNIGSAPIWIFVVNSATSPSFEVNTLSTSVFIWGAQAVEGTEALPYLKTETRLNRPRVDFSLPGCPNLLLEPQRTNTLIYSDQFDNAAWVNINGTITPNTIASPSGVSSADTFTDNSTNGLHAIVRYSQWSTTQQTFTIYVKPNTLTKFFIANGSTGDAVFFDLTTLTVEGYTSGLGNPMVNPTITPMANGWIRLSATHTATASQTLSFGFYKVFNATSLAATATYIGTGETAYIWGAQLEVGSYATSYIPTTTASVTRNFETVVKTGISSLINGSEGVVFIEMAAFQDTATLREIIIGSFPNDYIRFGYTNYGATIQFRYYSAGALIFNQFYPTTITNFNKIAFGWQENNFVVYQNGVKKLEQLSGATSVAAFNSIDTSILTFNGKIKSFMIFKTRLTDDELEALTGLGFNTYAEMASYYNYTLQ
jgi:hypothetical protein